MRNLHDRVSAPQKIIKSIIYRYNTGILGVIVSFVISIVLTSCSPTGNRQTQLQVGDVTVNTKASMMTDEIKADAGVTAEFTSETKFVNISFVGDILLGGRVGEYLKNSTGEKELAGAKDDLIKSDIVVGNLESPMSTRGKPVPNKQYTFQALPQTVKILELLRIDYLTLANNHILDYGEDGLKDTFDILRSNNIDYGGAGENDIDAYKPVIITKNGVRVAIVAASRVIPDVSWYATPERLGLAACYDPARTIQQISVSKEKADVVVGYIHWGNERDSIPDKHQKALARLMIDAGCDIVVGSHAHILQGLEFYKDKIIAYSLGNFIFTDAKKDTMILNIATNVHQIKEVRILPYKIQNYFPQKIVNSIDQDTFYRSLEEISFDVKIGVDGILTTKTPKD